MLIKIWNDLKVILEIFAIEGVELLKNFSWGHVNVVISHVVEFVELEVCLRGLSDELEKLRVSSRVSTSLSCGRVNSLFRSFL